jgi:hypothetical protein
MAFFMLEAGISTESCFAELALRMRVSKSAIVSVICMPSPPSLPARLFYAGNLALIGKLPKANAADPKFAKIGVRPATDFATVVLAGRIFLFSSLFDLHGSFGHKNPSLFRKRGAKQR